MRFLLRGQAAYKLALHRNSTESNARHYELG